MSRAHLFRSLPLTFVCLLACGSDLAPSDAAAVDAVATDGRTRDGLAADQQRDLRLDGPRDTAATSDRGTDDDGSAEAGASDGAHDLPVGDGAADLFAAVDGPDAAQLDGTGADATGEGPLPDAASGDAIDDAADDAWHGCTPGLWQLTELDGSYAVGSYNTLIVDGGGDAHIAYYDSWNGELKYAYRPVGGRWMISVVDEGPDVGAHAALAMDGAGGLHLSYYDAANAALKLAHRPADGGWTSETVDSTGDTGRYTDLAVDGAGGLHVSYYDVTNRDLRYAYKPPSGSWNKVTVDSAGEVGQSTSLALDATGGVHISYHDSTNNGLKVASRPAAGSWSSVPVDSGDSSHHVGLASTLAVDATGALHVAYGQRTVGSTASELRYATRPASGSWSSETVQSSGHWLTGASIALQGSTVIISYVDVAADALTITSGSAGSWSFSTVDAGALPPGISELTGPTSLVVDGSGGLSVSFRDTDPGVSVTASSLFFAQRPAAGSWSAEPVDVAGTPGDHPSVGVDAAGGVHIVDSDQHNLDVNYHYRPAGQPWIGAVVHRGPSLGVQGPFPLKTRLAVDAQDKVHITAHNGFGVFYTTRSPGDAPSHFAPETSPGTAGHSVFDLTTDAAGGAHFSSEGMWGLAHAHLPPGGSWNQVTADPASHSGAHSALAVDGSGGIHIAEYDDHAGELKYAHREPAGSWSVSMIDDGGIEDEDVGEYPSLDVDSAGGVHVCYLTHGGELRYAYLAAGGSWVITILDTGDLAEDTTALVVDADDGVHLAFIKRSTFGIVHHLYYAYKAAGGPWTSTEVAPQNQPSQQVSLDVDSAGGVHLAFKQGATWYAYAPRPCQ